MALIDKILQKDGVTNLQDWFRLKMRGLKTISTPEKEVIEQIQQKIPNPHIIDLSEFMQTHRLADMLSYEFYDKKHQIYQTSRSYGFILEATTLTGAMENTDETLKGLFALTLPDYCCMQIVLHASKEVAPLFDYWKNNRNQDPLFKTLTDQRINYYLSGTSKRLFPNHKICVRDFRLYISFTFEGAFEEENFDFIENTRNSIASIFKSAGMETRRLQPTDLINLVKSVMGVTQKPMEYNEYDDRLSIRDQIVDPDNNIYIDIDGMVINDTAVRSLAVKKYPSNPRLPDMGAVIGDMFSTMQQISTPFLFVHNIQILSPERTNGIVSLEAERTFKQSKNGMGRIVPIIDKKAQEYELMKQLISEGEGFINQSHYLHLFTPLGKSEECFQEALSVFRAKGWELVNNSNIQLPTLLCSLPLFHDPISAKDQKDFRMMRMYTQVNACNTMPLISDWKGSGTPTLMFLGRRGQIQFVDVFDNKAGNYNGSIVATSGSGKSYLANEIVTSYLAVDGRVWVIDVGKSYKNTCDLLEGQFIEFSDKSEICINPFSDIVDEDVINKEGVTDKDIMEDVVDRIEMLKAVIVVSAGQNPDDKTIDSFVEKALTASILQHKNNTTFTTICEELNKLNDQRASDIASSLHSYTKEGVHGKYFEGKANLNFNNRLIVLELEELKAKGQMVFVVLLIIMLKITQEMYLGERNQKKICLIDEAWDLLGKGNSGSFIETGYRRARKYGGSFFTCTQSIDDYYANNTTQACWNNADWKFLLRQGSKPKNATFNEYESKLLSTVTTERGVYSEVMITMGGVVCGICRLIVDPFTNFIYSSNANDVQLVNLIKENEDLATKESVFRCLEISQKVSKITGRGQAECSDLLVRQISKTSYKDVMNAYQL